MRAAVESPDSSIRNLRRSLQRTSYGADSLRLLNNIFDLTTTTKRRSVGREIIDCANRNGDRTSAFDAIRRLANFAPNDAPYLDSLYRLTQDYEESDDRSMTLAFIEMQNNSVRLKNIPDSLKGRYVHELVKQFSAEPSINIYERIVRLHAICLFLADSSQDDLLEKYMEHLGALVETLPADAYAIRNLYYVQAAMNYAYTGNYQKSIAADKKLLTIIRQMEENYKNLGRPFINYDPSLYIIYTRLLSNYPVLNPKDIEQYYDKVMELVGRDARANITYRHRPYAKIYYDMATANYASALDSLKKFEPTEPSSWRRQELLKMMITAARNLDRKDDLLAALDAYTASTDEFIRERLDKSYKEMQISYDIYELEEQLSDLSNANKLNEKKYASRIMLILFIAGIVLAIAVVALLILYRHSRNLTHRLKVSNEELIAERDKLREQSYALQEARSRADNINQLRSDFIKNLSYEIGPSLRAISEYSHILTDFASQQDKEYLANFVNIIELNCELLRTLADDLLTLSSIEDATFSVKTEPMRLDTLIPVAIETVQANEHKGLDIRFEPTDENLSLNSDPQRIQQILTYLLSNAIKFTDEGSVIVKCSRTSKNIVITVTDTGVGIESKYREKIFDRFFQVSKATPGAGLGLHIARQLARLLGGDIRLDTVYTKGARFVVTLPLS